MLLHKLDVPQVMPQTMAFVVDRSRLSQFRKALRVVVEDGSIGPWVEFCESRREAFTRQWHEAEVILDVRQIRLWHRIARQEDPTLPRQGFIGVSAHRYLNLLERIDGLSGREGWAIAALNSLREPHHEDDDLAVPLPTPRSLSWARELKFKSTSGAVSRTVLDPTNDVALNVPKHLDAKHMSPLDVLELARHQLSVSAVVKLLCDPFTPSIGPGPFLPPPPNAVSLQDPEWPVLPLFAVTHHDWPLVRGHLLGGKALLEAEQTVRAAAPTREWHAPYRAAPIDDARWAELVGEHWPRCRERFANALDKAYREHDAVLLLENNRSDTFWAGIDWPAPSAESGVSNAAALEKWSPKQTIRADDELVYSE